MARSIPEETIADIKQRADLAGIIGRTVKLKRTGRNLVGLCPFHSEKTPSFNVRPDDGFFYCFGCKASGDVVDFLERTTGRGFLDIISDLAAQTGVELPKVELDPAEEARQKERKRLLRVLELTQVFFWTRLQPSEGADEGRAARAYLSETRKIDDATIDQFGLGFAGVRDDGLVTFLKEQGFGAEDGIAAGVLGRPRDESRGPYDFFRHRITIPIRGARGEVLAFQGRIFGERATAPDGSARPKYINGPQTPVYDKSKALFGFFEAQAGMKQKTSAWKGAAVLVEGPLDAIAIYRAGIPTAVAPCGTSLTHGHVDEIKRKTDRIIICLDADNAGKAAASRAILMLLQADIDTSIVALPDKDPDQMVQAGRADELRGLVLGAPSALDALISKAREKSTGNMRARVQALDELLPFLAAPARELVRGEAVRAVARAFGEDEAVIAKEVERKGRKLLGEAVRGAPQPQKNAPVPAVDPRAASRAAPRPHEPPDMDDEQPVAAPRPKKPAPPFSEPEILLVESLLTHPHLAARCGILAETLRNAELKRFIKGLIELLVRFHDEDPRMVLSKVTMRPDGQIRQVLLKVKQGGGFERPDAYLPEASAMRVVEDAMLRFERRVLEVRLGELQSLLALADERNDHGERKRLITEQAALVDIIKASAPPAPGPLAGAVSRSLAPAPPSLAWAPPKDVEAVPPLPAVTPDPVPDARPPPEPPWAEDPEDDDPFDT